MKKIIALVCAVIMAFSFTVFLSSCSGTQGEQGIQGEKGETIKKIEFDKEGRLVITMTDGTVLDPVDLPKTADSDGLEYYPLPDGTYGVTAGTSLYLEEIVIPSTYKGKAVTQILPDAFEGAKNLKTITIPEGVTSIGDSAFLKCKSLESVRIPSSVTDIGYSAFMNATLKIHFDGTEAQWKSIKKTSWILNSCDITVYFSDGNWTYKGDFSQGDFRTQF